jgi:ribonuclease HI
MMVPFVGGGQCRWQSSSSAAFITSEDIDLVEQSPPLEFLVRRSLVAFMDDAQSSSAAGALNTTTLTPRLNPNKTYVLKVRGVTTRHSRGTGIGLVLYDPILNVEVWSGQIYADGFRISLEPEYSAIILGIDYVYNVLGLSRLIVSSSIDAVVNQINGRFSTNKESLQMLLKYVHKLQQDLNDSAIQYVTPSSSPSIIKAKTLACRALATRKSSNIIEKDNDWDIKKRDPFQVSLIRKSPKVFSRSTDYPAQSVDIDPSTTYLLQFDGGAKEDCDCAGVGMVIYDSSQEQEIWSGWYFHDTFATNNVAEYFGLVYGLKCASSLGIRRLVVESDSLLVVRQMNGDYVTREDGLLVLRDEARKVLNDFDFVEIRHIRRRHNSRADWLASHAMRSEQSYGFDFLDEM